MKKIKLLILVFGLFAAQVALAVQLPSTSYSSSSVSVDNSGIFTTPSGITVTGTFSSLGAGSQECDAACQAAFADCMEKGSGFDTCAAAQETCMKECQGDDDTPLGPAPIDGGLWILLTLAVISGAVTVISSKISCNKK